MTNYVKGAFRAQRIRYQTNHLYCIKTYVVEP